MTLEDSRVYHARVIAALVDRLGGVVELRADELDRIHPVRLVTIHHRADGSERLELDGRARPGLQLGAKRHPVEA